MKAKRIVGMGRVVERQQVPSKCKVLSSNPSTITTTERGGPRQFSHPSSHEMTWGKMAYDGIGSMFSLDTKSASIYDCGFLSIQNYEE
jgi:hypothetical protein